MLYKWVKRLPLFLSMPSMFLPAKIMCPVTGKSFGDYLFFFFFIYVIATQFIESAEGRNPYTREVYKRAPKRDEKKIDLKILHKKNHSNNDGTLFK
jgi:hypothetical protein